MDSLLFFVCECGVSKVEVIVGLNDSTGMSYSFHLGSPVLLSVGLSV